MLGSGDERLARWHSPPQLESVRMALRRMASSSASFYWDWAKFMGGHCSIHAWTTARPPLAAADHITLTEAGDERSARGLFAELMAGYDSYLRAVQAKAQALVATAEPAPVPAAKSRRKIKQH
jgi:hypothetical protein